MVQNYNWMPKIFRASRGIIIIYHTLPICLSQELTAVHNFISFLFLHRSHVGIAIFTSFLLWFLDKNEYLFVKFPIFSSFFGPKIPFFLLFFWLKIPFFLFFWHLKVLGTLNVPYNNTRKLLFQIFDKIFFKIIKKF